MKQRHRKTNQTDDSLNLDNIDVTILKMLLKDARTRYKKIAEACGISSPALTKRIENLRTKGVITGTRLFCSQNPDSLITAVVGLNIEEKKRLDVKEAIRRRMKKGESFMTIYDEGIGYYDALFGIVVRNIPEIDTIHRFIQGLRGVKNVEIHLWTGQTHIKRENLTMNQGK